ncbi:MAG: (2Fe-2S)-binding protein [Nitrospirae bacterium]|nr:MAG: Ferredoxin [Leptospirillum sp. Group IV 'UBA BS']MCL4485871.1 (2Fe-2S)-binding protein [Nitrospirota bacterium]MCL5285300.1 (2Fe-2S)-binding protein [Nitrospirota bacterium]
MPTVRIIEIDREIDIPEGQTILQGAMAHGIAFGFVCGGNAACGTCLVKVLEGLDSLGKRNPKEDFLAKAMMLDSEFRLGCQTEVSSAPLVISIVSMARGERA